MGLIVWWSSWFDVAGRGGAVLAVTKPPWVSWVAGAHGFDVGLMWWQMWQIRGGAEVVYQ